MDDETYCVNGCGVLAEESELEGMVWDIPLFELVCKGCKNSE